MSIKQKYYSKGFKILFWVSIIPACFFAWFYLRQSEYFLARNLSGDQAKSLIFIDPFIVMGGFFNIIFHICAGISAIYLIKGKRIAISDFMMKRNDSAGQKLLKAFGYFCILIYIFYSTIMFITYANYYIVLAGIFAIITTIMYLNWFNSMFTQRCSSYSENR